MGKAAARGGHTYCNLARLYAKMPEFDHLPWLLSLRMFECKCQLVRGGGVLCFACFSHLTIGHASLWRQRGNSYCVLAAMPYSCVASVFVVAGSACVMATRAKVGLLDVLDAPNVSGRNCC